MKLSDFNYQLPQELIAQQPARPRDHSRLMVLDRRSKKIEHKAFYNIVDYLRSGDVLVLNDTKVFPARLIGYREKTGGRVEIFLLKRSKLETPGTGQEPKLKIKKSRETWEALIGNRRKRVGQIIVFAKGLKCEIIGQVDQSVWLVEFNKSGRVLERLIDELGEVPTPPYIKEPKNKRTKKLKSDYQTVYAKNTGSVAAPTAGFHFTVALINKLKKRGVQFEFVTLHVGLGTFAPVKIQNIKEHKMHAEFAALSALTAKRLNRAKKEGRRIIAVGTTSVRTLEAFCDKANNLKAGRRWVDIFIYPGYKFKAVDGLVTNFHLPESTLMMLVSAFARPQAGHQLISKAYQSAVKERYRFYSFGDAMFIYN